MASENTVDSLFGPNALSEPAKPGSRRALRDQERRATAEIPVVGADYDSAPAVMAGSPSFDMNDDAVAAVATPAASGPIAATDAASDFDGPAEEKKNNRFRFFKTTAVAVAAVAAIGSSLGLASTAGTSDSASATELLRNGAASDYIAATKDATAAATGAATESAPATETAPATAQASQSFTAVINGKEQVVPATETDTYASALAAAGIIVNGADRVSVGLGERVKPGTKLTIVSVKTVSETEKVTEKFDTKKVNDPSVTKGETKVKTKGKNGSGVRTYDVRYENGKEVGRTLTMEVVSQKKVDEVVLVGTAEPVVAAAPSTSSSSSSSSTKSSSSSSSSSTKSSSTSSQAAAPAPVAAANPGSARGIAQSMLSSYGWGQDQFTYLDRLWQRESGWNHRAANPSSGAYGIPQALPGSKMASAGADWQTNPATQIKWGLSYIKGRYGSPAAAWAHSQSRGWY